MAPHRFNVFGRILSIEKDGGQWIGHWLGSDGKRRKAHLAIPADVTREELSQYLYDIFHESATPTNGDVVEIVGRD